MPHKNIRLNEHNSKWKFAELAFLPNYECYSITKKYHKQTKMVWVFSHSSEQNIWEVLFFFSNPSLFTTTPVLLICSTLLSTQRCSVLHCLLLVFSVGASTSLQMKLNNIQNVSLQPERVILTYPTLTSFVCNKMILLFAG